MIGLLRRCWLLVVMVKAMPLQFSIPQRGQECLYEKLEENESVTVSVFILSGAALKATILLEGPVAPKEVSSGADMQLNIDRFNRGERIGGAMRVENQVDFEHFAQLDNGEEDEDELPVMQVMADDEDLNVPEHEPDEQRQKRETRRRERREQYHKRVLEARKKREDRLARRREKMLKLQQPEEGKPFQVTHVVKQAGWYRFCVQGTWYQITAEMEMRKASELGGIDESTGHVYSYDQKALRDEEHFLSLDTKSAEAVNGVKDEDFEQTRDKLQKLRRLLADIQEKQQAEAHRLALHAATNEHSHSRMVLNSLLETVLFMAVTGYQVYTIRKWFSAAPVLGR